MSATHHGNALITLAHVTKTFTTNEVDTHALCDVTIDISKGEYVSISGPSGCGKSTMLSIIGLLDDTTTGDYLFDGRLVDRIRPSEKAHIRNRRIGFIFQNFNLIGDLTVFENVELPLKYRGVSTKHRHEQVNKVLADVEMLERARHMPNQLSGGQQQRVAVARAIVGDPDIILADEPTGNLDSQNGALVMELVRKAHLRGTTVCLVSHDPRYSEYAQRNIPLLDGQVLNEVAAV